MKDSSLLHTGLSSWTMSFCCSLLSSAQEGKAVIWIKVTPLSMVFHHLCLQSSQFLVLPSWTRIGFYEGADRVGCVFPFAPVVFTQHPLDMLNVIRPPYSWLMPFLSPGAPLSFLLISNSAGLKDLPRVPFLPLSFSQPMHPSRLSSFSEVL